MSFENEFAVFWSKIMAGGTVAGIILLVLIAVLAIAYGDMEGFTHMPR